MADQRALLSCPYCTRADFKSARGLEQHISRTTDCRNARFEATGTTVSDLHEGDSAPVANLPRRSRRNGSDTNQNDGNTNQNEVDDSTNLIFPTKTTQASTKTTQASTYHTNTTAKRKIGQIRKMNWCLRTMRIKLMMTIRMLQKNRSTQTCKCLTTFENTVREHRILHP